MAGVTLLRKVQAGHETTPGTAVAATAILKFLGTLQDDREVVFAEENVGALGGTNRTYIPKLGATMELSGEATFEQLPYILNAGIARVTPTSDTGSGWIYSYSFANATSTPSTDLDTLTLEGGDNQEAEEMEFSYVSDFSLSGTMGEAWTVDATFKGRQCSTSAFTALATSDSVSVEDMLFGKTSLYIDADTDTLGTTIKSDTLIEATLNVETGWKEKPTAGNLYFTDIKQAGPVITLDITFEHNASAQTEKDAWRLQSARQVRLTCAGNALSATGTYSTKIMRIDLAGKWEHFEKIDEKDGNDVVKGTFRAKPSANANLFAAILIVNELSSLV